MSLKTYLAGLDAEARDKFAARCRTSRGHLQNVAYGYRTASPDLAVAVEFESGGTVLAESTLAGDWIRVPDSTWPAAAGRPCLDPAKGHIAAAATDARPAAVAGQGA